VQREPWPSTYDRELDGHPRESSQGSREQPLMQSPRESFETYQRFIANPLLAVLAVVLAFLLVRTGVQTRHLTWFLTGIGLLTLVVPLLQFHCLDCGATGWLLRHRRHACPAVVARWERRQLPRFVGPRVKAQLLAWLYLLVAAFLLFMIQRAARRSALHGPARPPLPIIKPVSPGR
jgi:hypothetical protein